VRARTETRTAHLERRLVWSPRRALLSSLLVLTFLLALLLLVQGLTTH
jgi:hypothetical protein